MQIRKANSGRSSPARVFAAKYAWMLGWALHFTQNDQSLAEDLVQETILKVLRSYTSLDEIKDIEALLYISLKHTYLTEMRRLRRILFVDMEAVDYDSASQSLRELRYTDSIGTQNDLRRIAAYLCRRKQSTKSASILILRFFHECLPNEIAAISRLSRGAVDLALARGRQDLQLVMAESKGAGPIPTEPSAPIIFPRRDTVPILQLLEELLATIFEARHSHCLSREQLLSRYREIPSRPIEVELLAHIVSCRACLALIRKSGPSFSPAGPAQLSNGGSGPGPRPAERNSMRSRQVMDGMGHMLQAIYEHEPRSLIVLANSEVLATRDVHSSICVLKVEAKSDAPLESIEIMSEQGFCLLTMVVESHPPSAPPTVKRAVEFSLDRSLEAVLRFTAEGPIVEVIYRNPAYVVAADPVILRQLEAELDDSYTPSVEKLSRVEANPHSLRILEIARQFNRWLVHHIRLRLRTPAAGAWVASTVTLCLVLAGIFRYREASVPDSEELLGNVRHSALVAARGSGVVSQRVRIKTANGAIERTLHRDIQGVRTPRRQQKQEPAIASLALKLAVAGVSWDDPIDGAAFKDWHDHEQVKKDRVVRAGNNLLSLTTEIADNSSDPVAKESLTVRATDFHPVGRTIYFRDQSTVEVAELTYQVSPWNSAADDWFEPVSAERAPSSFPRPRVQPLLTLPSSLTDAELDEAELSARLVLAEIHADSGEQIEIRRHPDGIEVAGIVDTATRKAEIARTLRQVAHVSSSIRAIDELSAEPDSGTPVTVIRAENNVAQASPLEAALLAKGWSHDRVGALIHGLFTSVVAVKQDVGALNVLMTKYPSGARLTATGRLTREELTVRYKARLIGDVALEQSALENAGLLADSRSDDLNARKRNEPSLLDTSQRNLDLYNELMSSETISPRSPEAILGDMKRTSDSLHALAVSSLTVTDALLPQSKPPSSTRKP